MRTFHCSFYSFPALFLPFKERPLPHLRRRRRKRAVSRRKRTFPGCGVHKPTGQYHADFEANGKRITVRLQTSVDSITVQPLDDHEAHHRGCPEPAGSKKGLTFETISPVTGSPLVTTVDTTVSSKTCREQTSGALLRSWPGCSKRTRGRLPPALLPRACGESRRQRSSVPLRPTQRA